MAASAVRCNAQVERRPLEPTRANSKRNENQHRLLPVFLQSPYYPRRQDSRGGP